MGRELEPETVDLAEVRALLEERCGGFVEGEIVGRTRFRDEVVRHLRCSLLDAERVVDTMIGRGFVRRSVAPDGRPGWSTAAS